MPVLSPTYDRAGKAGATEALEASRSLRPSRETFIFDGVSYCPLTGHFTWQEARGKAAIGSSAGTIRPDGYVSVAVRQKRYRAHRLAWFLVYGEMPDGMIDHINGDRADNRITNLRIATPSQNSINRAPHPRKGIHTKPGRSAFYVRVTLNRRTHYVGSYGSLEEAEAAYRQAAERLHGEYVRAK